MKSIYENTKVKVEFPSFVGRLLYMHKAPISDPVMPFGFNDYQGLVNDVLGRLVNQSLVCYITIDEKAVDGTTHRRPGRHVDFNWYEDVKAHGGHSDGGGSHRSYTPDHGGHSGRRGGHLGEVSNRGGHIAPTPGHRSYKDQNGGMLLVVSHAGCRAYRGHFAGEIGDGGDCENIDVSKMENEIMLPHEVYYINAFGIHEPLVIQGTVNRSLLRINFHPEYVWMGMRSRV